MTFRTLSLLATTVSAVLKVDIDLAKRTVEATALDRSRGVFFGLTRYGSSTLLVGRNLDRSDRSWLPQFPTNAIYRLNTPGPIGNPIVTDPCLSDLHQIRRIGDWLCAVMGRGSSIAIFDLRGRQLVRTIDLLPFVPEPLRRDDRPGDDPHHFNSLFFTRDRLFILAHNWDRPSFGLEFRYAMSPAGPDDFQLTAVHENLGGAAHDIAFVDGALHVLDSFGGRLVLRGARERDLTIASLEKPFPRGLSITRDHIVIGYGLWSEERRGRARSATRLTVLDRTTLAAIMDVELGPYGNSCATLILSEPDLSDSIA